MSQSLSSAQVELTVDIRWQSRGVTHLEHFFIQKLNTWRDLDPSSILFPVAQATRGETISIQCHPGEITGSYDPEKVIELKNTQLNRAPQNLVVGRFYPQGILSGVPGIFSGNTNPFRLVDIDDCKAVVDLNHPLAKQELDLALTIIDIQTREKERGGSCTDWMQIVLDGPGMQQRVHKDIPTHFTRGEVLRREDEQPDRLFYQTDRLVPHVDATASRQLSRLYSDLISSEGTVLDLMASWTSHLPENFAAKNIHGLGMNGNELAANPLLSNTLVQDLNENQVLSFDDHFFDAVLCSLSVEYLIHPLQVFEEVARVLKPGGVFAVSFSNRWFPEKAIAIWKDLHDFERMGMVLEYFHDAHCFEKLETFSIRGYPRPGDDRYANRLSFSDPLFVIVGRKKRNNQV